MLRSVACLHKHQPSSFFSISWHLPSVISISFPALLTVYKCFSAAQAQLLLTLQALTYHSPYRVFRHFQHSLSVSLSFKTNLSKLCPQRLYFYFKHCSVPHISRALNKRDTCWLSSVCPITRPPAERPAFLLIFTETPLKILDSNLQSSLTTVVTGLSSPLTTVLPKPYYAFVRHFCTLPTLYEGLRSQMLEHCLHYHRLLWPSSHLSNTSDNHKQFLSLGIWRHVETFISKQAWKLIRFLSPTSRQKYRL